MSKNELKFSNINIADRAMMIIKNSIDSRKEAYKEAAAEFQNILNSGIIRYVKIQKFGEGLLEATQHDNDLIEVMFDFLHGSFYELEIGKKPTVSWTEFQYTVLIDPETAYVHKLELEIKNGLLVGISHTVKSV
jgi:hypothetical protein